LLAVLGTFYLGRLTYHFVRNGHKTRRPDAPRSSLHDPYARSPARMDDRDDPVLAIVTGANTGAFTEGPGETMLSGSGYS
jgi:hypothetical protein